MTDNRRDSPEPASVQGGERTASITPQGEAMNRSLDTRERVTAVPKTPADGLVDTRADPSLKDDAPGGYGMAGPDEHPGDRPHQGGDPLLDGDAQYGASPIRDARYREDHEVREGQRHHRGVQPGRQRPPAGI